MGIGVCQYSRDVVLEEFSVVLGGLVGAAAGCVLQIAFPGGAIYTDADWGEWLAWHSGLKETSESNKTVEYFLQHVFNVS